MKRQNGLQASGERVGSGARQAADGVPGFWVEAAAALVGVVSLLFGVNLAWAGAPKEIRLDYAYYSPASLVIRQNGWLEEEFKKEGIPIVWVFSQGSNRSLEYLNGGASDFASTSGISALVSRANGQPVKTVYMFNTQEASMLLVAKNSPAKSLADLKGKKVAATKGTDPFFFLLRALHEQGLRKSDVEIVHLQHPEGRVALERGTVDAWAGLDPFMAATELEAGSRALYRNPAFSSYGFLNTTEAFLRNYPDHLLRVLKVYERARLWMLDHPEELAQLVAKESKQNLDISRRQLTRSDFTKPVPHGPHIDTLRATAPILVEEEIVRKGVDVDAVIDTLVDDSFAKAAVAAAAGK